MKLADVAGYYASKIATHGDTPQGVDWNGEEGQVVRFEQLLRIVDKEPFSIHDLGCGYGALLDHLEQKYRRFEYIGTDIAPEMVEAARARRPASGHRFEVGAVPAGVADYAVASGIFNVKLERDVESWRGLVRESLDALDRGSRLGFAFNCLTSYSDAERMRDYLYYADPCEWFDYCKRRFSKDVALLHDYRLYEFTILVRKST